MSKKYSNNKQIELTSLTPVAEVAQQLQELVDGLQAGTLAVENGDEHISLAPTDEIELRFQVKQKDRDERVTMDLRWHRETTPEDFMNLEISPADDGEEAKSTRKKPSHKKNTKNSRKKSRKKKSTSRRTKSKRKKSSK